MKTFRQWLETIEVGQNPQIEELRNTLNAWMTEDQNYHNPVERKPFQQKVWQFISSNIDAIVGDMGDKQNGDYP